MWPKSRETLTESATKWQNHGSDPGARRYLVGNAGSSARFGDSQDTPLRCDLGEGVKRKAKDGDRCPAVEFAEGQPADPDRDLLRRASCSGGERPNPSGGKGTPA